MGTDLENLSSVKIREIRGKKSSKGVFSTGS
jgi:hypothetical protein